MPNQIPDIEVGRYALRSFRIDYKRREFFSVSFGGGHWKDGVCEARCLAKNRKDSHEAPDGNCSCGIYGTVNMPNLLRQYSAYAQKLVTVFAAEGKTIIGDTGLRTAYARVVAYWTPDDDIINVCQRELPDAKYFDEISEMLAAYDFPPDTRLPTTTIVIPSQTQPELWPYPPNPDAVWWRQRIYDSTTVTTGAHNTIFSWTDPTNNHDEIITPYSARISYNYPTDEIHSWGHLRPIRASPPSVNIDVLWNRYPTGGRWGQITMPGDHRHPDDRTAIIPQRININRTGYR